MSEPSNLSPEELGVIEGILEKRPELKYKTLGEIMEGKIVDVFQGSTSQENGSNEKPELQKGSENLPDCLPVYAYKVDERFKDETGDFRNPEKTRKINAAVLSMRRKGILKTESKDGGVYTTFNLPGMDPVHVLEPDLSEHSDAKYIEICDYVLGGVDIHKNEVITSGLCGSVDKWENKILKAYVKEKQKEGLKLPNKETITMFMDKLAEYVNKKYRCDIGSREEETDLFCRSINSVGFFLVSDREGMSCRYLVCSSNHHGLYTYCFVTLGLLFIDYSF